MMTMKNGIVALFMVALITANVGCFFNKKAAATAAATATAGAGDAGGGANTTPAPVTFFPKIKPK